MMLWDVGGYLLSFYKLSIETSMVSSKRMFVNKESTSTLSICKLESCWKIVSVEWNESMTVNSLALEGVKHYSKNVPNL